MCCPYTRAVSSSIAVALYGIIFSHHPQDDAEHIARKLVSDIESRDRLAQLVADIREELARPKQRARDILPLASQESEVSEADVREFLALVADRLDAALADRS